MPEKVLSRQRKWQLKMSAARRCSICSQPLAVDSKQWCPRHRKIRSARDKNRYAKRRGKGLCGLCGVRDSIKGKAVCAPCTERRAEYDRRYYIRLKESQAGNRRTEIL